MTTFTWRGEPIEDIRAWAAARGERMVSYRAERVVPNPWTGKLDVDRLHGEMPESFWNNLTIMDGWQYVEVGPDTKSP